MKEYRCGLCGSHYTSINSAAECEASCMTIMEEQYKDYYSYSEASCNCCKQTTKPTTVIIEMPNNMVFKITCGG